MGVQEKEENWNNDVWMKVKHFSLESVRYNIECGI